MASTFYLSPITLIIQFFNNVGVVLNGGFVYVYQAGTTTPVTTYTDSTGTTANSNPIALSSTGRLVSAGTGAPVAVWLAAGVAHKMVVTDASGNQMVTIDNLTSVNDVSTLLTQLATPTSSAQTGGVDLVANAVKSYLNFAAMRAAAAPTLVSGQTAIAIAAGQTTSSDNRGGSFYWNASSIATDDNYNNIQPSAITGTNPGRWVRISEPYLPNFDQSNPVDQGGVTSGAFTASLTGFASPGAVACTYYLLGLSGGGALVFLNIGAYTATSTGTTMTLTGLPSNITPGGNQTLTCVVGNNGANAIGAVTVTANSTTLQFGASAGAVGGFTSSGSKGLPVAQVLIYQQS